MTERNTSFSRELPTLQLAVDSTSLGEFKLCPRRYQLNIVLGWRHRDESVHLTFGILLHGGRERYDHARANGASHEDALHAALRWVLSETWDSELGRPRFPDPGKSPKNRLTLVRTLVWYLDEFGENDPLQTVRLANGKPAVELSFSFDVGLRSQATGEPFVLCGHLDRLVQMNDQYYISDIKSTQQTLSPSYFAQFAPHNQFGFYTLAGQVALAKPVSGLIVDAAQIGVTFSRFQRHLVPRPKQLIDEWLGHVHWWLRQMESCAVEFGSEAPWPMNDKSCDVFGGCPYRDVCNRVPAARSAWLEANYRKVVWDPMQRRGDI